MVDNDRIFAAPPRSLVGQCEMTV